MSISVLMPAYNAESHLVEAIESVLAQTYTNFEFIIIDDGSKDATLSIAKKYQEKDPRIVIDSHENMGMGKSLNRAMEMAKGEWIARMDADDIMLPNRLEEQVKYLQLHPKVDVLSCWAYYINQDGKEIGKFIHPQDIGDEDGCKIYLKKNEMIHILHPGVIMRKETILKMGGYNNGRMIHGQDTELWNKLLEQGVIICCMHQILMKYRMHNSSVTTSKYLEALTYDEWVGVCMLLRRQGKPEISFETFLENIKHKPIFWKINRWRIRTSLYLYRNAGFLYGNKQYLKAIPQLICTVILDPKRIITRLTKQIQF